MERKLRYKLHKVKKQWVTIAVASASLAAIVGASAVTAGQVSAEEVAATTEAASQSSTDQSTTTDDKQLGATTTSEQSATASSEQVAGEEATPTQSQAPADSATIVEAPTTKAQVASSNTTTASTDAQPTAAEQKAALSLSKVKQIDGKYYYVEEDGSYKKNFAITVNGQLLYFDETGALSSTSTSSYSTGLTPIVDNFSINNRAYNQTADSFELVDGYLTANSWYRPEKILRNGQTWEASTADDYRPLLMTWWPDKDTQVAYLNYMSDFFGGSDHAFTNETSQLTLNTAAQEIQKKIEQRITSETNTAWLRNTIQSFVTTRSRWNVDTENLNRKDHLQHGALLFENGELTPWANSDYRLINRTPTTQTGEQRYFADSNPLGGYELLLSNDVDNSNPIVQAEMLNQLHYLMNWGSIVMGDDDANFDGVRVDAVDNVNADLLQIYTNYFRQYYGVKNSEADALAHLSILEAWSFNDNYYNVDTDGAAIPMDNYARLSALETLTRPVEKRQGLSHLVEDSYNKERKNNFAYGDTIPTYSFVRAHDSEVQTIVAEIIAKKIDNTTDGFTFTLDQLKQAFEIYNEDMNKVEKTYLHYNIPAAYALLLTTMEAIPRVYYGDLYTDDGQYMATKTPYFDAISTMMQGRIAYVSGGQQMDVVTTDSGAEVMTSVRFGQEIMNPDDMEGTELSRTSGLAVLVSNDPDMKLAEDDVVTVNMGKIHANQAYRPMLLGTKDGVKSYLNDSDTDLVKYTDADGNLTFTAEDIQGYATVDMSGYIAVWVPVGAKDGQDIRVEASKEVIGNLTYNTSAAYDSQLIYEGFSNFQDFVENDSQYTNKLIAENADLFKKWGVTSFEIAPQYVSATDGSFIDSIIENGYAFTDRYDLAMSKNNKYGSKEDLANALKALHANGIQVILDWVPDQIYDLPGEEVVTATRVNNYGDPTKDAFIDHSLYAANTRGSGEDYQAQYGGEFLDELKEKFPEMFEEVMISNGQKLDTSVKIKAWEAKYLNGTNILKKGAGYVLSDDATGKYFTVTEDGVFLPAALTGDKEAKTGFYNDGTGVSYYSTSGEKAIDSFVYAGGNYYYFDDKGYLVTGKAYLKDGKEYYSLPNGIQLRNAIRQDDKGNKYYYGVTGMKFTGAGWSTFVSEDDPNTLVSRYFDANDVMQTGLKTIDGVTYYFDDNGFQVKGQTVDVDGYTRFFTKDAGNMVKDSYQEIEEGKWAYFDANGRMLKGEQVIYGQRVYFDEVTGVQVKGFRTDANSNNVAYYDVNSGAKVVGDYFTDNGDDWYYADAQGNVVRGFRQENGNWYYYDAKTGKQAKGQVVVDGKTYYFHPDSGVQVKGDFATDAEGRNTGYYDENSGELKTGFFTTGDNAWYYADAKGQLAHGFVEMDGNWYYFDEETGRQAKGQTTIDGKTYYFDVDSGVQVKGDFGIVNGNLAYFDAKSGEKKVNGFFTTGNNNWYYADKDGNLATGSRVINGQRLHFDASTGRQSKGVAVVLNGQRRYYDADSGEMAVNKFVEEVAGSNVWFYYGADGVAYKGLRDVNGQLLYFDPETGRQIKGEMVLVNNRLNYFDAKTGQRVSNATLRINGRLYHFDADGTGRGI